MTINLPPARRIPKNYRNVTGVVASTADTPSVGFESTLENDFYQLLRFDLYVRRFKEQPVKIQFTDSAGKARSYTPDVLVTFREDLRPAINMKPWLCEVKYRDDLRENWQVYRPKFKAAIKYARKHGWRFRIITEKEVHTP
ncbi:MAG TPA: Tn7 transposase TnsA N-terminal domain-containing protein, partial [Dongiaceae bacterium]|nr:Tn7 transposase TnsA N-terminal domain-containing protein [Dongiaceae bacterium]